jgi:hypothetical protein
MSVNKDNVMQLMVAPAEEVGRDIRKNLPSVLGLLMVTVAYILISSAVIRSLESGWTFLHACYFTVINMTTVGFGDVVPITHVGKIVAGVNGFVGLLLFGILIALFTLALQPSGWSATLTSADRTDYSDGDRTNVVSDRPPRMEDGVAEFLESLGSILRITERRHEVVSQEGKARIHILVSGSRHGIVEVYIDVHTG